MDLETIEDNYQRELEKIEREFLSAAVKARDSSAAEVDYRKKIKAAREKYYAAMNAFLENEKRNIGVRKKAAKREKSGRFVVRPGNFELSWWQRKRLQLGLRWFKTSFKMRNKIRENTPKKVSYEYYKMRLLMRRFFIKVEDFFEGVWRAIEGAAQSTYEALKEWPEKSMKYLSGLPEKIMEKLKRKKSEGKGEGKGGGGEGEKKRDEKK